MMPINRPLSASNQMNTQIFNTDANRELINYWESWTRDAATGLGERRDTALARIMACHFNNGENLDLSHLSLTTLPERLPDNLISLQADHNQLQHINCNFSDTLTSLCLSFNNLIDLPNNLPDSIIILHAANNRLTQLPDNLPTSLVFLNLDNNCLVNLPDHLPDSLTTLFVNHNQLRELPDTLPNVLSTLSANYNQLRAIPDNVPRSLFILNAAHNPLAEHLQNFPLSFFIDFRNSDGFVVDLNVISDEEEEVVETRSYLQKLALWDNNIDVDRWEEIHAESNAEVFATFLEELCQGVNIRNTTLREKIGLWLGYLSQQENADLRARTFEIAEISTGACVDRATFYWNKMHLMMLENQLLENIESKSISEVMDTALGLFRLDELRKIAASQVRQRLIENPRFDEDIEIYLAYECKLSEQLALPVYTEINFSGVASISDNELLRTKNKVIEQEKTDFLRYLVTESTLWNAKIEAWDSQKKRQLIEDWNDEIISAQFNHSIDERLKKANIPINDSDARRNTGRILSSDLLYKKLYRLTESFLKEHNAIRLIAKFMPLENQSADCNNEISEQTRL